MIGLVDKRTNRQKIAQKKTSAQWTDVYQFMKEKLLVYLNINCVQAFFALLDIIAYRIILTNTID
jgi:hypothetical protein